MRAAVALSLVCLAVAPEALAGALSRVRSHVRNAGAGGDQSDRNVDQKRGAGTLARVRRETRAERPRRDAGHGGHHRSWRRRARRPLCDGPAFGFLLFDQYSAYCPPTPVRTYVYPPAPAVAAPAYAEPALPSAAAPLFQQFAAYPYAGECGGFLFTASPGLGKRWSGQVQFELGSDFDGLDRDGVSFLLEGTAGFGVDFDWNTYTEELADGGHDELHIGELNLLYRVVETDRALVRVGVGAAWLGDRYDTNAGVNFTLQADLAPREPIVLSGQLDLGTLGDAQHLHAAGTVGVMLNRCEVFGGYDYRRIGGVEIQGPMVGVRVWF